MKKALLIICIVILMAASFAAGMFIPFGAEDSNQNQPSQEVSKQDDTANDSQEQTNEGANEMVAKNVFFSPKTGNDETGNGTPWQPFETLKKAEEYSKTLTLAENEEIYILEFLMSVDIKTTEAAGVFSSAGGINMIPFTGSTNGAYFTGEIVGTGYDTQKYDMGSPVFSARYLIRGKDYTGQQCSIFIENNGDALDKCTPTVITDSAALSEWQSYSLRTIVTPVGGGVIVDMYRIHD